MNHSILIADDSLTIQKVIRITLSGESYDLSECDNSGKLFEIAEAQKPSLVLLDFTLDEGISGYDICKKIQKISPETRVMIMYGTFDSVDDELFHASSASGKITKPFDGQKFITMCHQILEDQEFYGVTSEESPLEAINDHLTNDHLTIEHPEIEEVETKTGMEEEVQTQEEPVSEVMDEWSLNDEEIELSPETQDILEQPSTFEKDEDEDKTYSLESMISQELNDWGMSVPPTITEDKFESDAEIVNELKEKVSDIAALADIHEVEESKDLNFSNLVESDDKTEVLSDIMHEFEAQPIKEPVKLEIVKEIEKSQDELETVVINHDGEFEASELIDFDLDNNEDKFSALETQLLGSLDDKDELSTKINEEFDDVDNLWKIDEPLVEEVQNEVEEKVEEEVVAVVTQNISESEIHSSDNNVDIKADVKTAVHEYMSKHGKAIIERVAWEMIPDMAENIIREEVKAMAEKVLAKE